ncbi:unnamed protein product [Amoebophrya sp. A120]|nr:unnamed protein product [Amoebophrya sp. A120]|eukprot:GSA120T00006035001.1
MFRSLLPILLVSTSHLSPVSAKKKCPGHFGGKTNVANLCESHFPDKASEKIWFIKFYAPWCGHCNSMKQAWMDLGKELKDDKEIGIGAVDCDNEGNKPLCGKYGVQGFPTIKAIVAGKTKAYNGAREKPAFKQYILDLKAKRGSKGGSAKCAKGIFKSTLKDSVLPLCAKHFPDEKSKFSWVTVLYEKEKLEKSDEFNRLALEFGNEPADKNKSLKSNKKQSERLSEIKEKYSVKADDGKRKAGKSKDALAKFGAVCCDCEKEKDAKCEGLESKDLPKFSVYNHVSKKTFVFDQKYDVDQLTGFTLEKLQFVAEGGAAAAATGSAGAKKKKEEL